METVRRKIINKKQFNLGYRSYQAQLMGWMQLRIFTQINHSQIHTRQRRKKDILNIFQNGTAFGLDDYQF